MRGTTSCYVLGQLLSCRVSLQFCLLSGASESEPGAVRFLSPGSFTRWSRQYVLDFELGHWKLSRKHGIFKSVRRLANGLLGAFFIRLTSLFIGSVQFQVTLQLVTRQTMLLTISR